MRLEIRQLIRRGLPLMMVDLVIVNLAFVIAAFARNLLDYHGDYSFFAVSRYYILSLSYLVTPVALALHAVFGLYSSLWRYAGLTEFIKLMAVTMLNGLLFHLAAVTFEWAIGPDTYLSAMLVMFLLMATVRFGFRAARRLVPMLTSGRYLHAKRTMVVGAGETGYLIVRAMLDDPAKRGLPVVMVDDDPDKKGGRILGVRIVGDRHAIPRLVLEFGVERIFLAVSESDGGDMKELLDICLGTNCEILRVNLGEPLGGTPVTDSEWVPDASDVRGLRVGAIPLETLLGRDPVPLDREDIRAWIRGRTVMVTGGGGSIGSELCRQLAAFGPQKIVLFDVYENTSYELKLELMHRFPEVTSVLVIGSVRDREKLASTFAAHRPQVVFHAAAHKHVPTMESDPEEAIKNNVFGTYHTCDLAREYGAERCILISTDKAVNPTNVMGASKRLCEYIIKGMAAQQPATVFAAVRFGNVLGSNGSVIPLFRRQIAEGGPVTVTDRNVIRYFMTVSEASSLVIAAASRAKDGEIYILDMGEPVRIDDMVRKMIRLAGLVPDQDIEIRYVGLRPGEKMFEELSMEMEELTGTDIPKVLLTRDRGFGSEELDHMMDRLHETLDNGMDIRQTLKELIPTYRPGPESAPEEPGEVPEPCIP